MTTKTEVKNYGIGFLPLLAIVFIALKLTGYIAWSWWLVLSPLLIQAGLVVIALTILGVCYYLAKKS